jgi:hypothetical protein
MPKWIYGVLNYIYSVVFDTMIISCSSTSHLPARSRIEKACPYNSINLTQVPLV